TWLANRVRAGPRTWVPHPQQPSPIRTLVERGAREQCRDAASDLVWRIVPGGSSRRGRCKDELGVGSTGECRYRRSLRWRVEALERRSPDSRAQRAVEHIPDPFGHPARVEQAALESLIVGLDEGFGLCWEIAGRKDLLDHITYASASSEARGKDWGFGFE